MLDWFQRGFDPGTIITLDQPVPSQWEIVQKLSEKESRLTDADRRHGDHISFTVAKFLCRDPNDHEKLAFMRIYLQVPHSGTGMDDTDTRATQATTLMPRELLAYQELTAQTLNFVPKLLGYKTSTQDRSGPVPGGFAVSLVWEKVPGVRLGDNDGSDAFWALGDAEREEIRQYFLKNFRAIRAAKYFPDAAALKSLVWDKVTKTFYFVGFRDRNVITRQPRSTIPDVKWIAHYGLAKPDSRAWLKEGWDQDTTKWEW